MKKEYIFEALRWRGWRRGAEALLLSVSGGQERLCHCHKYFSTNQLLPTHHCALNSNKTPGDKTHIWKAFKRSRTSRCGGKNIGFHQFHRHVPLPILVVLVTFMKDTILRSKGGTFSTHIITTSHHNVSSISILISLDKVSANTASSFSKCYKKSDGSQIYQINSQINSFQNMYGML